MTYVIGNPSPGMGQAQNCGRVNFMHFKNWFWSFIFSAQHFYCSRFYKHTWPCSLNIFSAFSGPLTWVRIPLRRGVCDTTLSLCDKVCQWFAAGQWISPGTPVSSTNKYDRHDITEILLKVTLNNVILLIILIPLYI
jgi:hypothetical protein